MVGMVRFEKENRERACPAICGSCPALGVYIPSVCSACHDAMIVSKLARQGSSGIAASQERYAAVTIILHEFT
eukprot:1152745-Pelagomonas_calceolata.AAC.1